MKEFKLSDKRMKLFKGLVKQGMDKNILIQIFGFVRSQDKEFIRLLKEEFEKVGYGSYYIDIINKLSGDLK